MQRTLTAPQPKVAFIRACLAGLIVSFALILTTSSVSAQTTPLEWAALELGNSGYLDAANTMHLNSVFLCVSLGNNSAAWQSAYQPLLTRGLKAVAIPGCLAFNNRVWNETELRPFFNWLRDNPTYKNATAAIWPIDEPYWTNGNDIDGDSCPGYSHDSLARLYTFIKTETGGVPVHYDMGGGGPLFWYNQNLTGSVNYCYIGKTGINGIGDYLAAYFSNGADSSYNRTEILNLIGQNKAVTDQAGTKLAVLIRTWTRSTFNMTESMIYNLTRDILNTRQASALIYYPFAQNCCGYTDYLANHPALFDDIARAIDESAFGYGTQPSVTQPTPTSVPQPTQPPSENKSGDIASYNPSNPNQILAGIRDGKVNMADYIIMLANFGLQQCGNVADIDGDCDVDVYDFNYVIRDFENLIIPTPTVPPVSPTSLPPSSPTPSGPPPPVSFGYAVDFAPPSDFAALAGRGINIVTTNVSSNWQSVLDAAAANNQKVVIYLGWQTTEICQGSNGWNWNGSDWVLNANGRSFMDFIANYIKSGGRGFLALYTLHEPLNWQHSPNCTTDVQKKNYAMLKREAASRGLTSEQFPLFVDIGIIPRSDFSSGRCDYCATWYYPNGECSGSTWEARMNSCLDKMRTNYQGMSRAPNSIFVAKAQSFGGIGGYAMPTAAQMEQLGISMINVLKTNFGRPFVFMWYPWSGIYPQYLKNSPGGEASLQVISNVYNAVGGSLPLPTSPVPTLPAPTTIPTATPTSGPLPTPPIGDSALDLYGVKFGGSEDYLELAGLGVMNPVTVVRSNADVTAVVNSARNMRTTYPRFKPILWQYPEGWSCSGTNSIGQSFISHLNSNNYWNDVLAIYGLHEPLGGVACANLDQVVAVHSQIRQLSGGRAKLFGKMYSDTSYRGMGYKDGICDYCAVMYHPYRYSPHEFRRTQMLSDLNRDLNIFKSVAPGVTLNKFTPYLCTIDWPNSGVYGTGLYMPPPTEMLDGGSSILNYTSSQGYKPDGLVWYTWGNNSGWIGLDQYNSDGSRAGRVGVIRDVGAIR